MRDKKETVPTSETKTDENLAPEFTYDEWLSEVTRDIVPELDRKNEVTTRDLMKLKNMTRDRAYRWMQGKAESGEVDLVKRYDPRVKHVVNAMRRKEKP
jgi:hypothetical protein